ncbi:MAG: nucleotidyltransferase domain-containing protein [Phycisphaerales bacterium]
MSPPDETKQRIACLCQKHRVKELHTFGSMLRDGLSPDRDINVAVVFSRAGVAGSFDQYFDFKAELEQLLGQSVNLVCDAAVRNRIFRQEIDQTKELIYAA